MAIVRARQYLSGHVFCMLILFGMDQGFHEQALRLAKEEIGEPVGKGSDRRFLIEAF